MTGSRSQADDSRTDRKRVVVGVAGGIAAYKAATVVRQLTEAGHSVRVIPTESALRFVGAATFEALSGEPVQTGVFEDVPRVPHVAIGQGADLVVVAPATADLLARAAHGRADDLLTATLLTARCPVLFAPAMHTEMWQHPATVDNVETLRRRGAVVLEPASGRLTGEDSGAGRLPEAEEITTFAQLLLERHDAMPYDLAGVKMLVTAGGTREPLDPVRFIGNRSSGKQGYALARVAAQRGAEVTLIAGHTAGLIDPAGVEVVHVSSAQQLRDAVSKHAPDVHVLAMAAAVADFRPAHVATAKIKKGALRTPRRRRSTSSATTTCWRRPCRPALPGSCPTCGGSSASPPKPATRTVTCCFMPGRSCSARDVTCWWSTPSVTVKPSRSTTTTGGCWPPTAPSQRCSPARRL